MNHIGTQYIETERLILRRFELSDAQAMFDNWASDGEVTKYLTWPAYSDVSVAEQTLENWVSQYSEDDCYRWAIVLKENGSQPIGSIDVCRWREDDWREGGDVPEIGYCMGRRWWHQGVMSEALGAVIDFLFEQVGVQRIFARHDVNNPHSGGVMRKCGMKFQEIQEKSHRNNQGVIDTTCYIIECGDR